MYPLCIIGSINPFSFVAFSNFILTSPSVSGMESRSIKIMSSNPYELIIATRERKSTVLVTNEVVTKNITGSTSYGDCLF